jgi:hypothetical protein
MSEARALLEALVESIKAVPMVAEDEEYATEFLCVPPDPVEAARDYLRRADRPEARVAVEGLTVEMLADALDAAGAPRGTCEISSGHYIYPPQSRTVAEAILANLSTPRPPEPESRTEAVRRMQREGGGPVTAVMVSRADEAPRPPEPDRTAALVTPDIVSVARWGIRSAESAHDGEEHDVTFERCGDSICAIARRAGLALAATPEPHPTRCAAYGQDHSNGCPASDTYPLDPDR